MTTQILERTDKEVDLSDLDLLDDPEHHIYCAVCNGHGPRISIALCGKKGLQRGLPVEHVHAGTCPECADRFLKPCPRCQGRL